MKFKKLISSAVLFFAAFMGIAPSYADTPVGFTPASNKIIVQTTTQTPVGVGFTPVSQYVAIKSFTLSPYVTSVSTNVPAQISSLKLVPTNVTFGIPKK